MNSGLLTAILALKRILLMTVVLCSLGLPASAIAKSGGGKSAAQAAQQAKSRYGGKVVGVVKSGGNYKVKLLQADGRVVVVTISTK